MEEMYTPPGGPPQGPPLSRQIYADTGEQFIRDLLLAHYRNLEKSSVRHLFPDDMEEAAGRSADFFIQLLGGPPYFSQKYGPPRMRARHLRFAITPSAREIWLQCFHSALDEMKFPSEHRTEFQQFLTDFSAWMVNRRD